VVAGGAATASPAAGQTLRRPASAFRCSGQRIDNIIVHSFAPTAAVMRTVPVAATLVRAVHTTTQPDLIRRFLLLQEGDPCTELRRTESERILRSQPFIADATIDAMPDSSGGVTLDVMTYDEVALVAGATLATGGAPLRFAQLGDANIDGEGRYISADWRDGGAYRDAFGGRFIDNQLFGHPYVFSAEGHQYSLGGAWQLDATYPFYSDVQRVAWLARGGAHDDYVQFSAGDDSGHALHVARNYFDLGGIVRVGAPGHLGLIGATISGDADHPAADPVLVTGDGLAPDPGSLLADRYTTHRAVRLNALLGLRDIDFVRVRGFDALTATQDLPTGFQIGTMVGRSEAFLGSSDNDVFTAGDLYAGAANATSGIRLQLEAEARHDQSTGQWDGMLTDGRAVQYQRLTTDNTATASLEWSGGWRQLIPFSVTLSDPVGGVRGFSGSETPGGQRAVLRLEDRLFLGRPRNLGDLGVGAFADAGRLWAGDVPYGVTTPIRAAVGVSLLAAVPASSARLWRMDLVMAVNPETGGRRFELRLGATDKTIFFLPDPTDIAATREKTVPSSVFRWPQ
jgi:hypothetical protein